MSELKLTPLHKLKNGARIYFIGIGGISMGGLALMASRLGYCVAGSDPHVNVRTQRLEEQGILVHNQHHPQWIEDFEPDLVVYTAAIPYWNVELRRAHELGIETVDRSVFLGWLTRSYDHVINIAGTHGKTTVTAMCAEILIAARRNPSVHLGAEFEAFGNSTVRTGTMGDLLVSESCEYKNSLLNFYTTTAVLLNIDKDHLDFFPDIDALIESFALFASKVAEGGQLIYLANGEYMDRFLERVMELRSQNPLGRLQLLSFGLADPALQTSEYPSACAEGRLPDYAAADIRYCDGCPQFKLYRKGLFYAEICLRVPGLHNVMNALAAIAAANVHGASAEACIEGLKQFRGTEGRFSFKGEFLGAKVIADYAHHPTSTRVTLEAARNIPHRQIHVVYQPLTFSRVKLLFEEYIEALIDCKSLIFYEIFSDRESDTLGMSSRLLVQAINDRGGRARFAETYSEIADYLREVCQKDDLILFLGPEQVRSFAPKLVAEGAQDDKI